jgi:hypothetical protein
MGPQTEAVNQMSGNGKALFGYMLNRRGVPTPFLDYDPKRFMSKRAPVWFSVEIPLELANLSLDDLVKMFPAPPLVREEAISSPWAS